MHASDMPHLLVRYALYLAQNDGFNGHVANVPCVTFVRPYRLSSSKTPTVANVLLRSEWLGAVKMMRINVPNFNVSGARVAAIRFISNLRPTRFTRSNQRF